MVRFPVHRGLWVGFGMAENSADDGAGVVFSWSGNRPTEMTGVMRWVFCMCSWA